LEGLNVLTTKLEGLLSRAVGYSRTIAREDGASLMAQWLAEDMAELQFQLLLAFPLESRRAKLRDSQETAKGPWRPPR
jgi:hypothetical protein